MDMQVTKFLFSHIEAKGWYLDCSAKFMPKEADLLHKSLADRANVKPKPLEEEPEEVQPQSKPSKEKAKKLTRPKVRRPPLKSLKLR